MAKKNSFIVYDLKKITDFIFENQNSRTNDVEITDTLEYDKEKNKMVPKTKEIKEVKVNDDMSQTTIRYDLIKSFIDTLDMSEDMNVMSVGQSITLNTLQSYGMIKEIKM